MRENLLQELKKYESENMLRSWYEFLITIVILSSLVVANLFTSFLPCKLLISVFQGLVLLRMFVIYHDYNHGAILKKSLLASVVMNLFGILVLAPAPIWNFYHNYHHKNNTKISNFLCGSFPILSSDMYNRLGSKQKLIYRFIRSGHVILFSYFYVFVLSFCLNPFFASPKKNWIGIIAICLHILIIYTLFKLNIMMLFFVFFIPLFIMSVVGGYIFYVQHNSPNIKIYDNSNWSFFLAAMYSSTFIKTNSIWRWITANVGYHHIHHLNSNIPFYKLHHVLTNFPELSPRVISTFSIGDIKRCLKLKLWDNKAGKLVNFTEVDC